MPRGDGTGPRGQGPETGRGLHGTSQRQGGGRGRGGGLATGAGSYCVCPGCGEKTVHQQGQPCNEQKCPKCGTSMRLE